MCFRDQIFYQELPRLIQLGNKELLSNALITLRTIPNVADDTAADSTQPSNVWSAESLLSILFNVGEKATENRASHATAFSLTASVNFEQISFNRVVEALDVCFDLAKTDLKVFPSDVSHTVHTHSRYYDVLATLRRYYT